MACWSAENATKAYLRALKMGKRGKEPDVAEFISALAAGNNAQLMVTATSAAKDNISLALALVAAAHQTKGRVVMVLRDIQERNMYEDFMGHHCTFIEFLVGDLSALLLDELKNADFVLIDCKSNHREKVLKAATRISNGGLIVGYNAQHDRGNWSRSRNTETQFLPIGEGLLVSRVTANKYSLKVRDVPRKSCWVVKVDEVTGEENVFRIRSPRMQNQIIRA